MSSPTWTPQRPPRTRDNVLACPSVNDGSVAATPTFNVDYKPIVHPTPSCPDVPNVVKVAVHTTVTIPDYSRFYSTPINSFQPTFIPLDDGSLITPVLSNDFRVTCAWLVALGVMLMFFVRNVLTSQNFIRRVRIKKKNLFYVLLTSQLLGLVGIIPDLVSHFDYSASCTAVGMIRKTAAMLSNSLLMSGIMGTKAYRCLNNARFVLITIAVLRSTMLGISFWDIIEYKGIRKLTGGCESDSVSHILALVVIAQFVESFFLCMCFSYAVWKSSRSPVDKARLSLHPSYDGRERDSEAAIPKKEVDDTAPRRGWWDYVPDSQQPPPLGEAPPSPRLQPTITCPFAIRARFLHWWRPEENPPSVAFQRKPSLPGDQPIHQPPRVSIMSGGSGVLPRLSKTHSLGVRLHDANTPPSTSAMRRFITLVPGVEAFRKMLKNELLYTACITAIFFIVGVFMLVGVSRKVLFGPTAWIMLDWFIVSALTLHSFSRVVRRHEKEAILQHPSAWDPIYRAEQEAAKAFQRDRHAGRGISPISVASHWRPRHRRNSLDSMEVSEHPSREGSPGLPGTFSSPSPRLSTHVIKNGTASRSTLCTTSSSPSPRSFCRPSDWGSAIVLPSPNIGEYSSSELSTPHSDSQGIVTRVAASTPSLSVHRDSPRPSFDSRSDWEPPDRRGSL